MPVDDLIYLDYAASAPVDPQVRNRMLESLSGPAGWANPASVHAYGARARLAIGAAAAQVAALVHASPEEVIWTSGATEANNLGIMGAARFYARRGRHVVTVRTEHKSVLESFVQLAQLGFEVTYIEPDPSGVVSPDAVAAVLRPDTVLVAVMHANNETGVVQDIAAIGARCREYGILLHVDAAQSLGKLPLDMRTQCIDMLAVTAHKLCGPTGIGALILNHDTVRRIEPLLFGGGQQRGLRPGTLPAHQIVGMGEACAIASAVMPEEVVRLAAFRDRLWAAVCDLPGVLLNGAAAARVCSILNFSVQGVDGESLRYALRDIALSGGSACNSASAEPSYVLRSLGRSPLEADASLRLSVGRFTTGNEIERACRRLVTAVQQLQKLSPVPPE